MRDQCSLTVNRKSANNLLDVKLSGLIDCGPVVPPFNGTRAMLTTAYLIEWH
jgi:hypothetical protein